MRETWYVLEDHTAADPREVAPDDAGVLRHKSGVAVAMRGDAHRSRGVDPDEERAKAVRRGDKSPNQVREEVGKPPLPPATKDMKPAEPKRGYQTRESKSD